MALKQTVKRGQSLVDLMKKFNSTSNRLLRDNPQLRRGVRPGTVLNVPRQPARPPINNYNYYAQYRPAANIKQARDIIRQQRPRRFLEKNAPAPRPVVQQPLFRDERRFVQQNRPAQAVQRPRQPAFQPTRFGPIPTQPQPRRQAAVPAALARLYKTRPTLPGAPALARAIQNVPAETFNAPVRRLVNAALPGTRLDLTTPQRATRFDTEASPPKGMPQVLPQRAEQPGALWYRPTNARTGEPAHMFSADVPRGQMIYQSFQRNEPPTVMLRSDQQEFGLTDDDMRSIGYVWDERNGHWEYGVPIESPEVTGAAAPYGGSGYRPYYRRGYGGGGGGGGGGYSGVYPYPEQQQRGQAPQREFRDPARFGLVSWRI